MSKQITKNQENLFNEIKQLIEDARSAIGRTVNIEMTMMYWNIGRIINEEVLKNKRGEYGKVIVATLSQQLSWSHFVEIITLKTDLEREFYTQMCRVERWNVRTFRKKLLQFLEVSKKQFDNE